MSVSEFIKENRVLIAGFVLPLLLVALLAFAKTIPEKSVPAPEYKVAYMTQTWSGAGQIKFDVSEEGKLTFSFRKNETPSTTVTDLPKARVYIYDPASATNEEVEIGLLESEKSITIKPTPSLDKLTFSSKTTSPDNYVFEPYHYRSNTLITDIFINSHNSNTPVLTKEGRMIKLPTPANYYYGNVEFIGWITTVQKIGPR